MDAVKAWAAGLCAVSMGCVLLKMLAPKGGMGKLIHLIIAAFFLCCFAAPLMKKLGWPTIFCNSLEVAPDGEITGYRMRTENSKLSTVRALQSVGFETISCGDSFNDLGMIRAGKDGFLFKSPDSIKADNPDLPAYETYDELLAAFKKAMNMA